jgi:hypothetical protein
MKTICKHITATIAKAITRWKQQARYWYMILFS